jgi:hypothetical protein
MTNATVTARPATAAEIAADEEQGLPAHKRVVTVEEDTDGRATIGRANTVHRATVVRRLNAYGEGVGTTVYVECGSRRYRNAGGKGQASRAPKHYEITCEKCLEH